MLYERMSGKYKDKRSFRLPEIPAYQLLPISPSSYREESICIFKLMMNTRDIHFVCFA